MLDYGFCRHIRRIRNRYGECFRTQRNFPPSLRPVQQRWIDRSPGDSIAENQHNAVRRMGRCLSSSNGTVLPLQMFTAVRSLLAVPRSQAGCLVPCIGKRPRARAWFKFIVYEPFFQFMTLGILIWGAVGYLNAAHSRYTIHLGPAERQRLSAVYFRQFGQLPTSGQLQALVNRYVREEIFLREGLALHLDEDDEIIRRRIIQKYEFLQTELAVPDVPESDTLERWFQDRKTKYLTPERVSFIQVYFSADEAGEKRSKLRALKVLQQLHGTVASRAGGLGDAFPGPSNLGALEPREAARIFGDSEFSEQLFKSPVREWAGPYRSGYGWHLVYITRHLPPVLPPFTWVHQQALHDYIEEQRRIQNARIFDKLRAKYTVHDDGQIR